VKSRRPSKIRHSDEQDAVHDAPTMESPTMSIAVPLCLFKNLYMPWPNGSIFYFDRRAAGFGCPERRRCVCSAVRVFGYTIVYVGLAG